MTTPASEKNPRRRAEEYLRTASLYRLGILPTEKPHPRTRDLSHWAATDPGRAVSVLNRIDLGALQRLQRYAPSIDGLARSIRQTLAAGKRVYLCGCGATGRLSLSLESLWRGGHPGDDRVRSFMAGGDVALVHALEGFEDHPSYGARHLEELGFSEGDLLVACTEGGETPFVIGATERAAELSSNAPWFLYCNPDSILARHIERFRRVHGNSGIRKACLYTGPMALAGSTRMQASTVLQLAVGLALLHPDRPAAESIAACGRALAATDLAFLARFIELEAGLYAAGHHLTYRVRGFGITTLTDTTERAPTFSLVPFDQLKSPRASHSLCYVALEDAPDPDTAWLRLLNRAPRALEWPEVDPRTSAAYLRDFDFSVKAIARRREVIPDRRHHEFGIAGSRDSITLELDELRHEVPARAPDLFRHLLLKQILNIHSTVVMGRLGRYEGNLMTWVTPTNGKLVDRAARYVGHLLSAAGRPSPGYDEIVHQMFVEMARTAPGESIVMRTSRALLRRRRAAD